MAKSHTVGNSQAYRDLKRAITKCADDAEEKLHTVLTEIGEDTKQKMIDYVRLYFYEAYPEGDNYDRLGENGGFLSTISYEVDLQNLTVRMYCDWSQLNFSYTNDGKLPHHIDFDGSLFTTGLYDYIMYGIWDSPRSNQTIARGFGGISDQIAKELNKWVQKYITKRVRERLSSMGLNFVRVVNDIKQLESI